MEKLDVFFSSVQDDQSQCPRNNSGWAGKKIHSLRSILTL